MSLPIAVQLYSLRELKEPFDTVLAQVAEIGYTGVETVDNHGLHADEMRAMLDKHELQIVSSHIAMAVLEDDFDRWFLRSGPLPAALPGVKSHRRPRQS